MSSRTAFLSKLIGIYCMLVAIPMAANKAAFVAMVASLVNDAPVLYLFGLILVLAGVALILAHNVWSAGAAPVLVTLVGWASLIKGLLFLFAPPPAAAGIAVWGPSYERFFYLEVAAAFALGAYLAYAGFTCSSKSSRT